MIEDQHGFYHAIPIQTGSIALRITVEDFGQHNLLPLLNVFGRLYHGTVNKKYFNQLFQEKKQKFLTDLKSSIIDRDLEFQLKMSRVALTDNWKWPAFVNMVQENGQPEWATGGSRILASGLCKKNPEQTITVLFFDQVGTSVDHWIDEPIEITSDTQLHEVLGVNYAQTQSPSIQISAVLKQAHNHTRLFLHGIFDEELAGQQNSQELVELQLLDNLRQWQATNPQPQLTIYTDWPDLISDSMGVWNYRIAGSISQFTHHMFRPGHLEKLAYKEHEKEINSGPVLYVKQPIAIDLSEFLIWVDLEHTTFIEQDWNFLLYQRGNPYKLKMIGFSAT
jgi:hypothetical protein